MGSQRRRSQVVVCEGAHSVSVAPTAGIRIPPDLREQAELFAREHRWSLSETVRVGLERLVGYGADDDQPAERRTAA